MRNNSTVEDVKRVTILGAGSWGTALATLLTASESVVLWARDPSLAEQINVARENMQYLPGIPLAENVSATADLPASVAEADCVVFAVPSAGMRTVAQQAAPHIAPGSLLISAAKGLEDTTGLRMSEVIAQVLSHSEVSPPSPNIGGANSAMAVSVAALSGPNLALEVARGIPTASVAAASEEDTARRCQALWMGPTFRVYTSADITGVELAGAMKNVIAIGAGICEGLGFGDNSRAALMTRGLAEITRLGVVLGASTSTFLGLAGVGDLIATGGSRLSRNYRVGVGLGQGRKLEEVLEEIGQVAEGVPTTQAICLLARRIGVELPISEALHKALFEGADVRAGITQLMLRPPREEAVF
jgi:glycerol-3-phosphate dehydrogenase (NAD(P)+)